VVLENDLKEAFSEIFQEFNENAIAAASLAQVHFAKLRVLLIYSLIFLCINFGILFRKKMKKLR